MSKQKLVLIGNGMAGIRAIEEILKLEPDTFEITVFGKEPYPNYNRIQLSNVLQGDTTVTDITLNDWYWYEERNILLYPGEEVTNIDIDEQRITTSKGRVTPYDKLIIATGSKPFILPIPGGDKEGVTGFRDINDCEEMIKVSKSYKKAAVIGGGLLGLEAARGLINLGMDTTVVHLADHLMEMQLDKTAGDMLQRELENQGMKFLLQKQTTEILGDERVAGLKFSDGETLETDLVVMSVGIRPNIEIAKQAGIRTNRGIIVNDFLETEVPNIYAVGECVEHRGTVYGLVAPLYEQAQVLAKTIVGTKCHCQSYQGSVVSTQLKISDVDVFSGGLINEDSNTRAIRTVDDWNNTYQKIIVDKEGTICGAVLYGDISNGNKLMNFIKKGGNIQEFFATAQTEESPEQRIANMPEDELVCGCNGVTKGMIVDAIKAGGLTTLEEVAAKTNASRSCGRCKPLVADILQYTLGDEYSAEEQKETVCGCTTLSYEEVVAAIKEQGLKTVKEVMRALSWKNEEGCSKCRPALNYYLGMIYPTEYNDHKASRFVNERLHANIHKDGSFGVIPRMYGGVTNAKDLRKIADVADKYGVEMIKVTGGQRINLLGVKKDDLPKIWEELDMPSGHAYAKGLRTVKTCVGSKFCRFGTQDSIDLGVRLEKKFEGLSGPHKFKMGISACPRNCAEYDFKDIGILGLDGQWEVYVGGNGGTEVREAELLCTVKTDDEVMEWIGAFLQYYRENAQYLERTSNWVKRTGIETIRGYLENKDFRNELNERMEAALSVIKEPWRETIENEKTRKQLYDTVTID